MFYTVIIMFIYIHPSCIQLVNIVFVKERKSRCLVHQTQIVDWCLFCLYRINVYERHTSKKFISNHCEIYLIGVKRLKTLTLIDIYIYIIIYIVIQICDLLSLYCLQIYRQVVQFI